jgi:hypothetical protein
MSDSHRTRAAAGEAIVGTIMVIGGVLMSALNGFGSTFGYGLVVLGAAGAAHAVLLGLGLVRMAGDRTGEGERRASESTRDQR